MLVGTHGVAHYVPLGLRGTGRTWKINAASHRPCNEPVLATCRQNFSYCRSGDNGGLKIYRKCNLVLMSGFKYSGNNFFEKIVNIDNERRPGMRNVRCQSARRAGETRG